MDEPNTPPETETAAPLPTPAAEMRIPINLDAVTVRAKARCPAIETVTLDNDAPEGTAYFTVTGSDGQTIRRGVSVSLLRQPHGPHAAGGFIADEFRHAVK